MFWVSLRENFFWFPTYNKKMQLISERTLMNFILFLTRMMYECTSATITTNNKRTRIYPASLFLFINLSTAFWVNLIVVRTQIGFYVMKGQRRWHSSFRLFCQRFFLTLPTFSASLLVKKVTKQTFAKNIRHNVQTACKEHNWLRHNRLLPSCV